MARSSMTHPTGLQVSPPSTVVWMRDMQPGSDATA